MVPLLPNNFDQTIQTITLQDSVEHYSTMPETSYTVASNDQLLGGNLRKKCACNDLAEAARKALDRVDTSASKSTPQSPTETLATVGADILDLHEHSSEQTANTTELINSFPEPPRLAVRRATTPDIWLHTDVSEPTNASDGVEEDVSWRTPLTDIYFSPLHISGSRCELSSPLNSPLTTPTQELFDASLERTKSEKSNRTDNKVTLSAAELNHLVRALVESDMVQERLTSKRLRRSRTEPRGDYQDHQEAATSPQDLQRQYESTFRNRFSDIKASRAVFSGVQLVDPNVEGSPNCMISKGYDAENDDTIIGDLAHIAIPRKSSVYCSLQILPRAEDQPYRVILRVVNRVLQRTSGKQKYLLIASIDVTEGVTKATLFELLSASTLPLFDQTDRSVTTTQCIAKLRSDTCTMQTLTLLSELSRIRDQFIDFYIARTTEVHGNGVPAKLTIPLVSEGLYSTLSEKDGEDLRSLIVGMLGRHAAEGEAFTSTMEWDGEERRIRCIPLVGDGHSHGPSWVCFARDGFDIGDW